MTTRAQRVKYALAAPAFIFAVVFAQFSIVAPVSAAAVTWDGEAGDGLFSSATNWSNDLVPVNGDNLIFPADDITNDHVTLTNDLTDLSVSGISHTGESAGYGMLTITGNALTLTGDITNNATDSGYPKTLSIEAPITLGADASSHNTRFTALNVGTHSLALNSADVCALSTGILTGSGSVTLGTGSNYITPYTGSSSFSGVINVPSGTLTVASNQTIGSDAHVVVSGEGTLVITAQASATYGFDLTLGGTGVLNAYQFGGGCGGAMPGDPFTSTLSGDVTLTSDFKFAGHNNVKITGAYIDNGHTFAVQNGSAGTLTTPKGETEAKAFTTSLDGDQPAQGVGVANKETATLNGTRGSITVGAGGTLKGTGTASSLYNFGTVNPGNSPGVLHVTNAFQDDGTYQVEIENKDSYDQIVVSPTGTVIINSSTAELEVILFGDWEVNAGDTFTIIDNQGTDPVSGNYAGLTEGAQFTVNGATFSISYEGGDGNDVVLTAVNTVSAPNTGVLQIVKSNPMVVLGLGLVSVVAVLALTFRRKSTQ